MIAKASQTSQAGRWQLEKDATRIGIIQVRRAALR
jgi:hypothetical protein